MALAVGLQGRLALMLIFSVLPCHEDVPGGRCPSVCVKVIDDDSDYSVEKYGKNLLSIGFVGIRIRLPISGVAGMASTHAEAVDWRCRLGRDLIIFD